LKYDLGVDKYTAHHARLATFLQDHPWDPSITDGHRPVEYLSTYVFQGDLASLWEVLSDTSGINNAIGLSPIVFTERNGIRFGKSRLGGRLHVWEEVPWEWEYGRYMLIRRIYSSGWASYVRAYILIDQLDETNFQTTINFGWIPRNYASALVLSLAGKSFMRAYGIAIAALLKDRIERTASRSKNSSLQKGITAGPEPVNPVNKGKIERIVGDLLQRGFPGNTILKLTGFVEGGAEADVWRIRPKQLATAINVDAVKLIPLMLHATSLGLLNMSWDVVCPHCRGVRKNSEHLWDIPQIADCEVCEIEFETRDINALEITFHPNPDIRKTGEVLFCSAEPAKKSHILVQRSIATNDTATVPVPEAAGVYRMRLQGEKRYIPLAINPASEKRDIIWETDSSLSDLETAPGALIRVHNGSKSTALFIVEKVKEDAFALRPKDLFGIQEFRDLFSQEALSTNVSIDVGVQVVMFVDVVGSSALYSRAGNARAFAIMRAFFMVAHDIALECNGAIIKTLGDAVLMSFANPLEAFKAALKFVNTLNRPGFSGVLVM
jgi:hypothetical protein